MVSANPKPSVIWFTVSKIKPFENKITMAGSSKKAKFPTVMVNGETSCKYFLTKLIFEA